MEPRLIGGLDTKRNLVLIGVAFFLDALGVLATSNLQAQTPFVSALLLFLPLANVALLLFRRKTGSGVTLLTIVALVCVGAFASGSIPAPVWILLLAWVFFAAENGRYKLTLAVLFFLWVLLVVLLAAGSFLGEIVFISLILLLALAAAQSERFRIAYEQEVVARQLQREIEWKAELDRTAQEERNRVSRELHDIVAHSLSVMVVQARGARRLPKIPDDVAAALKIIEESGRQSLHDLRQVLDALRNQDGSSEAYAKNGRVAASQSSFDDLGDLIVGVEESGLTVSFKQTGESNLVSNGVQLAV